MAKIVKAVIQFKDPDFTNTLLDGGLTEAAAKKVTSKADCGEYFTFQLSFDAESGQVLGCSQIKAK